VVARGPLRTAPLIADRLGHVSAARGAELRHRARGHRRHAARRHRRRHLVEPLADAASGRSMLRFARGTPASAIAVVENVGTLLPGESRAMGPGTYTIQISADGFQTASATREVLPGFMTIVTPRLPRRSATVAATATAPASSDHAPPATAPAAGITPLRAVPFASAGGTACALVGTGAMCWGDNRNGQLGGGLGDSAHAPVRVAFGQPFRAISVGATTGAASRPTFKAGAGDRNQRRAGHRPAASSATPVPVSGVPNFVAIVPAPRTPARSPPRGGLLLGLEPRRPAGRARHEQSTTPVAVSLRREWPSSRSRWAVAQLPR